MRKKRSSVSLHDLPRFNKWQGEKGLQKKWQSVTWGEEGSKKMPFCEWDTFWKTPFYFFQKFWFYKPPLISFADFHWVFERVPIGKGGLIAPVYPVWLRPCTYLKKTCSFVWVCINLKWMPAVKELKISWMKINSFMTEVSMI